MSLAESKRMRSNGINLSENAGTTEGTGKGATTRFGHD
jgi:hypothetical protein